MAELIAKSACSGLLPLEIGTTTLREAEIGPITALGPRRGQENALSEALKQAHGMALPAANRATGKEGSRALWFGVGQVLLMGVTPDEALAGHAALVDQSDAWAVVHLEGAGAADVLAHLVPIDLREAVFKRGHTARTDLFHMSASITRLSTTRFQVMVFRSMAQTLVHDMQRAMESVAARSVAPQG